MGTGREIVANKMQTSEEYRVINRLNRLAALVSAIAVMAVTLSMAPTPVAAQTETEAGVFRLYCAYFLRQPDAGGFQYWLSLREEGLPLEAVAENFALSTEFRNTYGKQVSTADFVTLIYSNLFERAPDADGFQYWIGIIDDGLARGRVMTYFSESQEYKTRIETVGCEGGGAGGGGGELINTDKIHVLRARSGTGGSSSDTLVRAAFSSWNPTTGRLTARTVFGFGAVAEQINAWAKLESGLKPHRPTASLSINVDWNGRLSAFNSIDSHANAEVVVRVRERDSGRVVWEQSLLEDGVGAGYQGITALQVDGEANRTFQLPTLDTAVIYRAEVELRCTANVTVSLGTTVCDMSPGLLVAGSNPDYGVTLISWSLEYDKGLCPPELQRDGCIYR